MTLTTAAKVPATAVAASRPARGRRIAHMVHASDDVARNNAVDSIMNVRDQNM